MASHPSGTSESSHSAAIPAVDIDAAYAAELDFLYGRLNYERVPERARSLGDFRLERMRELLARIGDPQFAIPCIHITGSKGKGSVATMVARVLEDAGLRIGLFTSPHLIDYAERFTINGALPQPKILLPLMLQLRDIAAQMDAHSPQGGPTFFELTTALGWLLFLQQQVDYVVLEVGLGGRLDSTNICAPLVTAITSISFDHTRLLGETLEKIASEKAGIIKSHVPVVSGAIDPSARQAVAIRAEEKGAPLRQLGEQFEVTAIKQRENTETLLPFPLLSVTGSTGTWDDIEVGMPGNHQATNASLALAILVELRKAGLRVSDAAIRSGLSRAQISCRIEVLSTKPLYIVDAAHNVASLRALIDTLKEVGAENRRVVFAVSRDKDAEQMLQTLDSFATEIILTQYVKNPRSVPVPELEEMARRTLTCQWSANSNPLAAVSEAIQRSSPTDLVVGTGSLFLAAELKESFLAASN
ncbi:MAG: bifunctional folylpolyglutamate synthase/dihydrofolate synthase [Planctomycetaceae bacterium]|nr:bifunctional folylpolyglutamate synthase/dihydrofolate synthase [Planctomycetaceae bacterium]